MVAHQQRLLTDLNPNTAQAEGGGSKERELGCNSHNHPSVNDLLPPLIVVHEAWERQSQ